MRVATEQGEPMHYMNYDYGQVEPMRRSHHQEIVKRIQSLMIKDGIDALVAFRGDNINWINTHPSVFLDWHIQGVTMLVIPREGHPIGITTEHEYTAISVNGLVADWRVCRDWTGWESRYAGEQRVHFASDAQLASPDSMPPGIAVLKNVLGETGAARGKVALELTDVKAGLLKHIEAAMPHAQLVNSQPIIQKANRLKTPYEIYNLRYAAHHQWRVAHEVMSNLRRGTSYAEIRRRIEMGAAETPDIDGIYFLQIYMGKVAGATKRHYDITLEPGDLVSIDIGFTTRGYIADSGRAYVLGEPSNLQRRIADAYYQAHMEVKERMAPGARLGDLYDLAANSVRRHDLSDFRRGHIGHSLGCANTIEEYPYIRHGSNEVLEPGMVMTLEVPFYGTNFGVYFEEDILLINETGHESLTPAPLGLTVIPC
jgi:Xaa-Pro dipeptidase